MLIFLNANLNRPSYDLFSISFDSAPAPATKAAAAPSKTVAAPPAAAAAPAKVAAVSAPVPAAKVVPKKDDFAALEAAAGGASDGSLVQFSLECRFVFSTINMKLYILKVEISISRIFYPNFD